MKKYLSFILLYLLISPFMLTGCGQSGPLYLPDQMTKEKKKHFYE